MITDEIITQLLTELDKAHPTVSIALGGKPTLYSRSADTIRQLMKQRGDGRFERSMSEALNSGDGTYRP